MTVGTEVSRVARHFRDEVAIHVPVAVDYSHGGIDLRQVLRDAQFHDAIAVTKLNISVSSARETMCVFTCPGRGRHHLEG